MADQSQPDQAAAGSSAAADSAEPPLSAEEVQTAATDALDEITMPSATVAGEEVESAEEALSEAAEAPAAPDYKDLYLRASADMDNLRKRARRDVGTAEARGIGRLARELLPAIDNLERALQAAETAAHGSPVPGTGEGSGEQDFLKGIRLVQAELVGALTRAGISIEDPKGRPFDPHRHEALAQTPVAGTAPGIVVEVYQPGYVLGDAVLRAARVVVSG
ncbi:MAG: nucleotide exchange factor GrpE [Actinomycetota bacterium]|nr:nucleotide exchange factor GrpE [Actinomycetota bacterium]